MGKRPSDPPKDTLKRLPGWHEKLLDEHFKGLPGLYVRQLLDQASTAERSEQGKLGAEQRHEARNKVKESARAYYLENRNNYRSNKDAARHLEARFGRLAFGTYANLVSKWSRE